MRIVFLGSPAFALPTLEALLGTNHEIVAVVTQPDRPAGRGHAPTPPPVKVAAASRDLTVLQPDNVSDPASVEQLRSLNPDAFVVAAYGQILRQRLLDVPARGSLNVHASLLPRHRGAAPVAASILAGDDVTGVTIMEVVRALDAGPIVAKVEEPVAVTDTTATLERRLALAGGILLSGVLEGWFSGAIIPQPQDQSQATYAPQIRREDALIDWSLSAIEIWRRVRAFDPWPVAFTRWRGEDLRIHEAWPLDQSSPEAPGTVLGPVRLPAEAQDGGEEALSVQTGHGALAVRRLQLPGGRPMTALDFIRGRRELIGTRLGE